MWLFTHFIISFSKTAFLLLCVPKCVENRCILSQCHGKKPTILDRMDGRREAFHLLFHFVVMPNSSENISSSWGRLGGLSSSWKGALSTKKEPTEALGFHRLLAESKGFEPSKRLWPFTRFPEALRVLKPLIHKGLKWILWRRSVFCISLFWKNRRLVVDADDCQRENVESYMTPVTCHRNPAICAASTATLHGRRGIGLEAASQPSRRRNDDEGKIPIYLAIDASFAAFHDDQQITRFQSYLALVTRLHDSL